MSDTFYFDRTIKMVSDFEGTASIDHAEKLKVEPVMFNSVLLESSYIFVALDYLVGDDELDDMALCLPLTSLVDDFSSRMDPDELGDTDSIHNINELICEFELCIAKLNKLKAKTIKNEILLKTYK